jgi:hypothetical protein
MLNRCAVRRAAVSDSDAKNARNDQDDELLDEDAADALEDLEVDEDAEAVRGGVMEEEGQPQIE